MLTGDLTEQVQRIHIRTRRLVDGVFAGHFASVFKGRGLEFAEVREYQPGDDVRTIDWNVTARLGQPFVKQYVEERELIVMLLIDVSASGFFGSAARSKNEIAAELAAALALSALNNNDRVGLLLFSDRIERYLAPQKGRNRALRLIREMLSVELAPAGRGTDIAAALDYLNKIVRQRTLTFLLSDFLASDYQNALRGANRRHEMVPIVLNDPRESELPASGLVRLRDLETDSEIMLDTGDPRVRDYYASWRDGAMEKRRMMFRSLGIEAIEVRTDRPLLPPLLRYMRRREIGR